MTKSPNPSWKPGDAINPPFTEMQTLDPAQMPAPEFYKMMIGAIVPRPIAFVSTVGADGSHNLAPFSFFNGVSSVPPCLIVSIFQKQPGVPKDTLRNILETRQFVVNSANEWLIEPLVHSAAAFPYGVDEMQKIGLTPLASQSVKPPRVKESAVQFECEVLQTVPIGEGEGSATTLVIGRIVLAHIDSEAFKNGRVDFERIRNLSRLGGASYGKIGEIFELPIPRVTSE